jgi:hypothetical protein
MESVIDLIVSPFHLLDDFEMQLTNDVTEVL